MDKLIENRISQLATTGFLKEDKELHALLSVLNKIEKSDKFKGIGDQRMIAERVQKEQISFINNMQEMFSRGDLFLKFFNFHNKPKPKSAGQGIWRVIGLVEKRDSSSFSKVFAQERKTSNVEHHRRKRFEKNTKKKSVSSKQKQVSEKPKPQIIKKVLRNKEGS